MFYSNDDVPKDFWPHPKKNAISEAPAASRDVDQAPRPCVPQTLNAKVDLSASCLAIWKLHGDVSYHSQSEFWFPAIGVSPGQEKNNMTWTCQAIKTRSFKGKDGNSSALKRTFQNNEPPRKLGIQSSNVKNTFACGRSSHCRTSGDWPWPSTVATSCAPEAKATWRVHR